MGGFLLQSPGRTQRPPLSKTLRGVYRPPPDKSITHRALFFAALAKGTSVIRNPLSTGDCISTLKALQKLGISIKKGRGTWTVTGRGGFQTRPHKPGAVVDCGNSGTTLRLLMGILASRGVPAVLSGDASLKKRPMKRVIEPLRKMGADISARKDDYAPVRIRRGGQIKGITWRMPVASAQVKSALLLAGLAADGETTVIEPSKSRDHTERMMKGMGVPIKISGNTVTIRKGGFKTRPYILRPFNLTVPGDFSSAAFIIAAAAVVPGSKVIVRGVNLNPTRTGFLSVLKEMGAKIRVLNTKTRYFEPVGDLEVSHSNLRSVTVSGSRIPLLIDEIPILAVVASQAGGRTAVSGAGELRVKESDRIKAIVSQLKRMGVRIEEKRDGFIIQGPCVLRGASCDSFGDHRMAMALAVAGLAARGRTAIKGFGCARVSYPGFIKDLKSLSRPL